MIDLGLLLSMVVTLGVPIVVARRWSSGGERSGDTDPLAPDLLDVVLGPLLAGLVVARLTAIVLDDPAAFGRVTDVLIIRSGVEFWPGVVVAAIVAAAAARRSGVAVMARLAALVPLGLLGTAGYEATCVVRGGCFGPTSPVGLRPQGVSTTMVPVGIVMAVAMAGGALWLHARAARLDAPLTVALGALIVAGVRSVGSFWLPHLGDGLTRQHLSSLLVTALAAAASAMVAAEGRRTGGGRSADREEGRRRPPPGRRPSF